MNDANRTNVRTRAQSPQNPVNSLEFSIVPASCRYVLLVRNNGGTGAG